MINAHQSLTGQYIKDHIKLTHELYPSFATRINCTYYRLNLQESKFNPDFNDFYANITNENHGGRYDVIYNFPVTLSTNNTISENASEKGITIIESTAINCVIDSFLNIVPKDGDIITFMLGTVNPALYSIINIETSSMLAKPYSRLTLQAIPNLSIEKMQSLSVNEFGFVKEYHYIFSKDDVLMIIKLQKLITKYIEYFNEIYNSQLDAHIDKNNHVFLEFEKAFNELVLKYSQHLNMYNINKSYLHENLLLYYDQDNPFLRMMIYNDELGFDGYKYTAKNKRLEKNRRRSLNNRPKIYRLINPEDANDKLIVNTYPDAVNDLLLPINIIHSWKTVMSEDFKNNVKEQMIHFLDNDCVINSDSMFINAIHFAQILYILDNIVSRQINKRFTNFSPKI